MRVTEKKLLETCGTFKNIFYLGTHLSQGNMGSRVMSDAEISAYDWMQNLL